MGIKYSYYVSNLDIITEKFEVKNYETNKLEIMSIEEFKEFVSTLKNSIIYQNDLNIVAHLLPGGECHGKKEFKFENAYEIMAYTLGSVRFKSFSALCPSDQKAETLMKMYNASTATDAMIKHLEYLNKMNGKDGIKGLRSTICGQSVQIFFRDIKYDLWRWKKQNKVYINTLEEFNNLHAGCKRGILKDVKEYTIRKDCVEFDLSAAYCGAFIQSDKFPIGKPRFHKNLKQFVDALKEGENAKVIFTKRIPEIDAETSKFDLDLFDEFNNVLALEYYDMKLLSDLGINIIKVIKENFESIKTFVTYDECGYIHSSVREKIVSLQQQKERYNKGTAERSLVKCQMEFIYGKAIQKRDYWTSDEDVVKHYKGRGENYIMPQMSNHASAYVRYQMFKAINALGDDVYYFDTDGIKCKDTEKVRSYFEQENYKIFELNEKSGFDTNIGCWKVEEFDEILFLRSKMYITRVGDFVDYVIAGFDNTSKIFLELDLKDHHIRRGEDKIKYINNNLLKVVKRQIYIEGNHIEFDFSNSFKLKRRKEDNK